MCRKVFRCSPGLSLSRKTGSGALSKWKCPDDPDDRFGKNTISNINFEDESHDVDTRNEIFK